MLDRFEIRLSGTGGQGLVLAGIILAEAAGIYEGKNVVQTVSYGPAARGGTSRADVVISDREIDFPKAMGIDLLLAMSQMACDESAGEVKPTGILVVDAQLVTQVTYPRVVKIPFTRIARDKCGREQMANIVALGALGKIIPSMPAGAGTLSLESLEAAVMKRIPRGTEKLNQTAFAEGIKAAEETVKKLVFEEPSEDHDQV
ncbi:MAG: 2-oxoglutarate ferredoxin oxidoreductase, gamma subunit [Deltaproteobacteria bacterium]|jgi:2-oxoglutarate ferredoxin oxidoreductase subunit gamma|nr:2-oxoglutarate ferredoxin oxidoreductase, gamma subunit [Deltaproteobacteria bacterium]MBP1716896.1 2-oxoglutarate ferredoxin oxidoreductase, gamma subunit [Deltaproteobacteria bacterium]